MFLKKILIITSLLSLYSSILLFSQEVKTVAVIEFEGLGITKTEVKSLTNRLRSNLVSSGEYDVIERGQMNEILEEQGFQLSGCTSESCMVEAGQLLGVQFMLAGSISLIGSTYSVEMRFINIETGKIFKAANYDMEGTIDQLLTYGMIRSINILLGKEMAFEVKKSKTKDDKPTIKPLSKKVTDIVKSEYTDPRDNQVYKTITIGDQTWMAENLKYKKVKGAKRGTNYYAPKWNGLYYSWEAAQEACPEGWHIPTEDEFQELKNYINDEYGPLSSSDIGWYLRSKDRWEDGIIGSDVFGFNAKPSGYCKVNDWKDLNARAYFWTSQKLSKKDFIFYILYFGKKNTCYFHDDSTISDYWKKGHIKRFFKGVQMFILGRGGRQLKYRRHIKYYSVRCVKN